MLDMTVNCKKTVCMIFNPICRSKVLLCNFPKFRLSNDDLQFVNSFRYLGHLISDDAYDNRDIEREIRNLFIRTNTLTRKFSNCSKSVKIMLFKSFCLCFYGIALWKKYTFGCINRLKSAYHKCIKSFFGFSRMDSMTGVLMQLGLPSFDTVMWNYRKKLSSQRATCDNLLVKHLHSLSRCT